MWYVNWKTAVQVYIDKKVLYKLCDMWIAKKDATTGEWKRVLYKLCDMWILQLPTNLKYNV